MPSRACTSLLQIRVTPYLKQIVGVNSLSGLYLIVTLLQYEIYGEWRNFCVNSLSGLYLIVTFHQHCLRISPIQCQFPLGLVPHCYLQRISALTPQLICVNSLSGLYLIVTTVIIQTDREQYSVCQFPLGLVPHCYR